MNDIEIEYRKILDYIFAQLPMFTRVGVSAYKKSLDNIIALTDNDGKPHLKYKTIHIGGTNGKGSCTHLLASILQENGFKTGVYISPHYVDFRERIKINGVYIDKKSVIDYIEKRKEIIEKIQPSFFEITAAMAFWYFAKENIDIAVIEVGLGGRLDSTNIIQPELSLITHIAYDHMNVLGNTLPEIATEKAGIIKPEKPVVIGKYQTETAEVFIKKAEVSNAEIAFADQNFQAELLHENIDRQEFKVYENGIIRFENITCPLLGNYQKDNIQSVLQCVKTLNNKGFEISKQSIENGIKKVKSNTKIFGRFDILQQQPLVICDSAHNEDGIRNVMTQLKKYKFNVLHIVWGNVNDKDISKMLKLLPKDAKYYFCMPNIPRGLPADDLKQNATLFNLHGASYQSVKSATEAALEKANDHDLIYIGGSTFVVAEVFAENMFDNKL